MTTLSNQEKKGGKKEEGRNRGVIDRKGGHTNAAGEKKGLFVTSENSLSRMSREKGRGKKKGGKESSTK